ncbi:hypothetical protein GOV05_04855 [Candidatus Woesearchaeota archaeon]|nr:hypothetical protein [Candidatus Woesearchaeota archaeon]
MPASKKKEELFKELSYKGYHPKGEAPDEELWEFQSLVDAGPSGYPQPIRHYELLIERQGENLESAYYFLYQLIGVDIGHRIEKIIDTYAASQASSQFGNLQARLSMQQGQISQYLKGISDMVKGLFQLVRELRIIEERLQFYFDTYDDESGNKDSSEIVLKGLWVDQVEGGAKNPSSVYGLAANVGFTILPDLFFRIRVKNAKRIDERVDELKFNEKVKEILKRKLRQYHEWKKRTFSELKTRKQFLIKYLRQHYESIQLYISWIKPYLRNVKNLQMAKKLESNNELISSFESNISEIEFLGIKKGKGGYNSVAVVNMLHRSRPELNYHAQEYQNKGPTHTGKLRLNIRGYAWTDKQIEDYKEYKLNEDLELLSTVDESIQAAMDALGDDLKKYLKTKGEEIDKPITSKKKKVRQPGAADPFLSVFKGFAELGRSFFPAKPKSDGSGEKKPTKKDVWQSKKDIVGSVKTAEVVTWLAFKNFKKGNGMLTWW